MGYGFEGKVAAVTGAATGIGRATAIEFAKHGAAVAAVDCTEASETVDAIRAAGGKAEHFICDVSVEKQVEDMLAAVVTRFGKLDAAFNCAGIGPDGVRWPYSELTETTAEDWKKIIDVNLTGTFFCLKHQLKLMQKQGFGAIVNTSSTGGDRAAPGFNAYGPSKAGVVMLTELAANENAKYGIRINAVCPGPTFGTQLMINTLSADGSLESRFRDFVIPMRKFGQMQEVAQAVLWLCSDLASHTTGQSLFVDGGMHVKP